MKKLSVACFIALLVISLSGCAGEPEYPYIEAHNNGWNFSNYNRNIPIGSDYEMDQLHSYEIVETEQGIDVIIHFADKEENHDLG